MKTLRHHRCHATVTTAIVTILACSLNRPTAALEDNRQAPPVRSGDMSITQLMAQAVTRSPTFKRLVAGIEASNGIIYVDAGVCPQRVPSCLPFWMISSGRNRLMRIIIDRRRLDSDRRVAGAIAHELQHATEVLGDRFVTTATKMHFFFVRYAPTGSTRFETMAAIHAGIAVENEWRGGDVSSSSDNDRQRQHPNLIHELPVRGRITRLDDPDRHDHQARGVPDGRCVDRPRAVRRPTEGVHDVGMSDNGGTTP